jgi:predicted 2-oxoglutarate/Fe(II)-dependent dioxygenase YbiX
VACSEVLVSTHREIAPGVVSVQLCTSTECVPIIAAANEGPEEWMRATISEFDPLRGKAEIFDDTSRKGMVKASRQIPAQCAEFEFQAQIFFDQILRDRFSLPSLYFEDTQLVKYKTGGFFKKHTDWGQSHPRRCVSFALYLNDQYDGGELNFPLLGVKYKPVAGECVAFPSDYVHSGEPLSGGEKYVFLSFMCSLPPIF